MTEKLNGNAAPAPTLPKPKASKRPPAKRFLVLEVIQTVEAESEEQVRSRLPGKRAFIVQEISK